MQIIDLEYLPPLSSMKALFKDTHIGYSLYEKFTRMSFLNRCIIPTANGLTGLSIPLKGGRENNLSMGEVEIDNSQRWQVRHWRTITSAYNRSPFFEFYASSLAGIYHTRYDRLYEWNLELLKWTCFQLKLSVDLTALNDAGESAVGKTEAVMPRNFQRTELIKGHPVYPQVFMEKIGFQPNVSILDLLSCTGNNSMQLLQRL